MTEQKQIEEIKQVLIKTCKHCRPFEEDYMQSKYAEAIYEAGYRKTFTSDLASDAQKAFKEGYSKGVDYGIEFGKVLLYKTRKESVKEFAEKLKESIFDYFGVKTIEEARQELSLIASTLTYDVVIDRIDELLKEYEE